MNETMYCGTCGNPLNTNFSFCGGCGAPIDNELELSLLNEEVFSRIYLDDTFEASREAIVVPDGNFCLVRQNDQIIATLTPGRHKLSEYSHDQKDVSIYLIASTPQTLTIKIEKIATRDPIFLVLEIDVGVSICNPVAFFQVVGESQPTYKRSNITSLLYVLIEKSMSKQLSGMGIKELKHNIESGRDLVSYVGKDIEASCKEKGLNIDSISLREIECDVFNRIQEKRVSYGISAQLEQSQLDTRKILFDVYSDAQIQDLAEETAEVAHYEKRTAVWERFRNIFNSDFRSKTESRTDLEDVLREADREKTIKDQEFSDFVSTLEHENIMTNEKREFLLNKIKAERNFETEMLKLRLLHGIEEERILLESRRIREEIDAKLELDNKKTEFELLETERKHESTLRMSELTASSQRSNRIDEAKTMSKIADIERDQDTKDLSMAIEMYQQFKKVKREDQASQNEDDLLYAEKQTNLELQKSEKELDLKLRESRARHDQELERIDALSKVNIETLIAVSGEENAKLLTELARTRSLSGLPPEKILAMNAERSPEIIEALKEILTAAASTNQLDMYERLITQVQDSSNASQQANKETVEMMSQLFDKALTGVKEVATEFIDHK